MNAASILSGYRYLYCALIATASVQTLLAPEHEAGHVGLLACAEIAGALLLLGRRTQWLGAWLLLLVFSCAQLVAARASAWPVRFALYAASAFLIVLLDPRLRAGTPLHQPR